MKSFLNVISSFLFLLTAPAYGSKVIGQVVKSHGHSFLMRAGKSIEITRGSYIQDFDEILTEDGAEVMVGDFRRRQVTLSGGTHAKWMNQLVELKRGYLWVQSVNPSETISVQTANAQSSLGKGEMVVSFDVSNLKTQVLSLSGNTEVSGLLTGIPVELKQGQFTVIHKDYEEGVPREPTSIGLDSLKSMRKQFALVKPLSSFDEKSMLSEIELQKRSPAAIPELAFELPAQTKVSVHESLGEEPEVQSQVDEKSHPSTTEGVIGAVESMEIPVIRREELPQKGPAPFSLQEIYEKKLQDIAKKKASDMAKAKAKVNRPKVRLFGVHEAKDLRAPASTGYSQGTNEKQPNGASSEERNKLLRQLSQLEDMDT